MLGKDIDKKKEILKNPKYEEISRQFELLFKSKGLYPGDKINNRTWFIKDKLDHIKTTPTNLNEIVNILIELNETDEPKDLSNIKVGVQNFIYKVCETLIEANNLKNKIQILIKRDKDTIQEKDSAITELRENLKQNLIILEEKISKSSLLSTSSSLTISILQMDNFPVGTYNFSLKTNEEKSVYESYYNKKTITLDNPFNVNQKNNTVIFRDIIEKNRRTFDKIEFSKCNIDFEKSYSERSVSGSSLSTFSIVCKRQKDNYFYEGVLYFHDFLLLYIDKIMASGSKYNQIINLNLSNDAEKTNIVLELEFVFDPHTLFGIYQRIHDLYERVINQKNASIRLIEDILEYFEEISGSVQNILDRNKEEKRDGCCQCLII